MGNALVNYASVDWSFFSLSGVSRYICDISLGHHDLHVRVALRQPGRCSIRSGLHGSIGTVDHGDHQREFDLPIDLQ